MMQTLLFILVLIIGLLFGITYTSLYILKNFLNNNLTELPKLKNEKKNN